MRVSFLVSTSPIAFSPSGPIELAVFHQRKLSINIRKVDSIKINCSETSVVRPIISTPSFATLLSVGLNLIAL